MAKRIDWSPVLTEYQTGQFSISALAKKYNISKSTLSVKIKAMGNNQTEQAKEAVETFDRATEQILHISNEQPELAQKVIEIVQDKHPHFKKAMETLSSAILKRGLEMVPKADANDLKSLSKAMQTTTDTLGVSQRHAPRVEKNNDNADHVNDMTEALRLIHEEQKQEKLKLPMQKGEINA